MVAIVQPVRAEVNSAPKSGASRARSILLEKPAEWRIMYLNPRKEGVTSMLGFDSQRALPSPLRRLALAGLALFLCAPNPASGQPPAIPPLAALTCPEGGRLIFEAGSVERPAMSAVYHTDWGGWLDAFSLGTAIGGIGGGVGMAGTPRTVDESKSFQAGMIAALKDVDLRKILLDALERQFRPRTSCATAFMTSNERHAATLTPSDRVVGVTFNFFFLGGKPNLRAFMGAALIAKGVDIAALERQAQGLKQLSDEAAAEAQTKVNLLHPNPMDLPKMRELMAAMGRLMSNLDGMKSIQGESPSHSTKDWLAGNGKLIRSEYEATVDRLTGQLAATLFP